MNIKDLLKEEVVLTDGAMIERLRHNTDCEFDENILNSGFIYNDKKRCAEKKIYQSYLDVGKFKDLPIIITTPTWKANPDRIKKSQYNKKDVNKDNVSFLRNFTSEYSSYKNKIFIAGMIGCKGDAYNPLEALSNDEAYEFHSFQLTTLSNAGADLLFAATMPAISEIRGVAKVCSGLNKPYIISFMVTKNGRLLDGTPISDAINEIDSTTAVLPIFYMANCVHPLNLIIALQQPCNDINVIKGRLLGLQANASDKSPDELDMSEELHSDTPINLANYMAELKRLYGFKVFGGCCGTDEKHLLAIANRVNETKI
jgi:homocysteine S-methyltransferase